MQTQFNRLSLIDRFFNLIEKQRPSDRIIMKFLGVIILISGIFFIFLLNKDYGVLSPTRGGVVTEGILDIPRFINPALAINRVDQDTTALLYSGLMKINENGELVPNLADRVSIKDEGKTYNIILKQNLVFHDKHPLTSEDVAFTINLIKNPDLKSPLRAIWDEVEVEIKNDFELDLKIPEPYAPFIENLTLGIMPKHIWGSLPIEQLPFSQYNTEPIGSGTFQIESVHRDSSGLINSYVLKPVERNSEKSNLSRVELKYFQNTESLSQAFQNKIINSTAYLSAKDIKKLNPAEINVISEPIPRIFSIFLNQNRSPALRDKSARQALNLAIDRKAIVENVLGGYGVPTDSPIINQENNIKSDNEVTFSLDKAIEILEEGGWKKGITNFWEKEIDGNSEILSIVIRTNNTEIYEKTALLIAENWRKLGAEVQIEQYEQSGLVQSVVRARDFQALLLGLETSRMIDLYSLLHSSQKDDPGLNISQYTNISVDKALEKIKTSEDKTEIEEVLAEIDEIIKDELPIFFIFKQNMIYVLDKDITPTPIINIGRYSDRFMNIDKWYAKTEILWPIFQE